MSAVKIVECEDEEGNKSFQKTCPPGASTISEKRIATGSKSTIENEVITQKYSGSAVSATMYIIPDCSPCNAVRELLQIKDIPLTEKNVVGDIDMQAELVKLNGSLNVPITIIGNEKLSGYNRTAILEALKSAGWVDPNAPAEKAVSNDDKKEQSQ